MQLKGKTILVLGLGESGLAMARWLSRAGARVSVADSRAEPPNRQALMREFPEVVLHCGEFVQNLLDTVDAVAISPGIPLNSAIVQEAYTRNLPVLSEISLFVEAVRARFAKAKIIAITGSNGKTTTTALTAHLLNSIGVNAIACGNISPSALDALMAVEDGVPGFPAKPDVWVLELSSFQLESTSNLGADAALVLNISEDHLDRHINLVGYAAVKARIFEGAKVRVINADDPYQQAWQQCSVPVIRFALQAKGEYGVVKQYLMHGTTKLLLQDEMPIVGLHNASNALAALALCEAIGIAPQRLLVGLQSFKGLAHRVELVATINGVRYYDDSKGTNVGATVAAISGLACPVAVILGGEGKGQDFSPLKTVLLQHARAVALIGRDAPLIATAINGQSAAVATCASLPEAVHWCAQQCTAGDAVLLSPACASFDMFHNYGHRAEVFIATVRELAQQGVAC